MKATIFAASGRAADIITTWVGLQIGYLEGNPGIGSIPGIILSLAYLPSIYLAECYFEKIDRRELIPVLFLFGSAAWFPAIWNMLLILVVK